MARPANADAARTQRRILDSALTLFSQRGARGASIRAIAAQAGVSVGMINHYFGSKDGLYDACLDAMYAELSALQAPLMAAVADGADVADAIRQAVVAGYGFARQHPVELRLLQREILAHGALSPRRQRDTQAPFLEQAPAVLAAALMKPPADMRLALQSLVMLISRYALSNDDELALFTQNAADPHQAVVDHLIELADRLFGLDTL
ncbi:MAG: helix-turn-helix domain-containing protein [Myxococcota bacterium]